MRSCYVFWMYSLWAILSWSQGEEGGHWGMSQNLRPFLPFLLRCPIRPQDMRSHNGQRCPALGAQEPVCCLRPAGSAQPGGPGRCGGWQQRFPALIGKDRKWKVVRFFFRIIYICHMCGNMWWVRIFENVLLKHDKKWWILLETSLNFLVWAS